MLRRLFGRRPIAAALAPDTVPQPARLPFDADGNPLYRLFDTWQLPWREPRAIVEAREGIRRDPLYDDDAMFVRDAAQPPGVLQPWNAGVFERYVPTLPIARFSAIAWLCDDTAANLHRIAAHVAQWIGPAPIGLE